MGDVRSVENSIFEILEEATGQDREDLGGSLDLRLDLDLDSLDFAELEISAKEELDLDVGPDDLAGVRTVDDFRKKLKEMVEAKDAVGDHNP